MPKRPSLQQQIDALAGRVDVLTSPIVATKDTTPVPSNADPNWRVLPDGTRLFIGKPEVGINNVANIMLPVPAAFAVGAFIKRLNTPSDMPHRIIATGADWITAIWDGPNGRSTLEGPPAQYEVVAG